MSLLRQMRANFFNQGVPYKTHCVHPHPVSYDSRIGMEDGREEWRAILSGARHSLHKGKFRGLLTSPARRLSAEEMRRVNEECMGGLLFCG